MAFTIDGYRNVALRKIKKVHRSWIIELAIWPLAKSLGTIWPLGVRMHLLYCGDLFATKNSYFAMYFSQFFYERDDPI